MNSLSLTEYAQVLTRNGRRNLPGALGSCWVRDDSLSMVRFPYFCVTEPSRHELRRVLWQSPAALASYHFEPDTRHPANAVLYVCRDRTYALDKLSSNMRRDIRRGLRELRIERITADQLIAAGGRAVRDTNRRHGLEESEAEEFRKIALRAKWPGQVFLGAWKDDQLAAYLSIIEVEDWVEIRACYSADAQLQYGPNHALVFFTLSHYLAEKGCRVVGFGSSSIQSDSNKLGLHAFKTRIGFEMLQVHRAFACHPLLRPFTNRLTLRGVNTALSLKPGNLRLKKVRGVLEYITGSVEAIPNELSMDGN